MPKADATQTPSRRTLLAKLPAFAAVAAATGAPGNSGRAENAPAGERPPPVPVPGTTAIAALSAELHNLVRRRTAMDAYLSNMPSGPAYNGLYADFDTNLGECFAIQDKIVFCPALTLEDAANQLAVAFGRVEWVDAARATQDELDRTAKDLRGLIASVLLAVVQAGNLDIDRIGWGDLRHLCAVHAPLAERRQRLIQDMASVDPALTVAAFARNGKGARA